MTPDPFTAMARHWLTSTGLAAVCGADGSNAESLGAMLRDLDANAYERGVRDAAAAVMAGGSYSPALKRAKQRILALLDKEGGGDG